MDLRFALRSFLKQPAFCITAILTLALGIGANTAIFSVFNAVILRPFPYRDPDRVVMIWQTRPNKQLAGVAATHYREWVKQSKSFDSLAAVIPQTYNIGAGENVAQIFGIRASSNLFSTLGVRPAVGRDFVAADGNGPGARVAIITYGLWQSRFAGDSARLGQTMQINGEPFSVVGVLPKNFEFIMPGVELVVPLVFPRASEVNANKMAVFGRMQAGGTIGQANQEMAVVEKRLGSVFPEDAGWTASVVSLRDMIGGNVRPALVTLLVAVGLVLLIACANVANLLLARSDSRYREVAIRSALGAGRARLMRQLLTETMLLALAGCLTGLVLAYGGLRLLVATAASQLPRIDGLALDFRVLVFAISITVITGLLFGLLPSHQLLGGDLQTALREAGRGSNNSAGGRRSRNIFVISEIALSLMLAIGANLMLHSLLWLENQDRGFSPEHLLTFRLSLPNKDAATQAEKALGYQRTVERIRSAASVRAAGATNNLPVDGYRQVGSYFHTSEAGSQASIEPPSAALDLINTGYFQALGIPIIRGREFTDVDRDGAPPVAIVSSALARQFFPGENPVGRRIILPSPGNGSGEISREIVGVAGDVRYLTKRSSDSVEIYLPYLQVSWPTIYVVVRTGGDPALAASAIRTALRTDGWHQPISDVLTMEERLSAVNGQVRLNSLLAGVFAMIALVLAAVGIYGVISYSVVQRSKEIGIRMALGATRGDILLWVVRQGLILAVCGVAIGLAGQFALSRMLRSLLFGTSPNDWSAWLTAAAVLGVIALIASYIPAWRATQGDPVLALRDE